MLAILLSLEETETKTASICEVVAAVEDHDWYLITATS